MKKILFILISCASVSPAWNYKADKLLNLRLIGEKLDRAIESSHIKSVLHTA